MIVNSTNTTRNYNVDLSKFSNINSFKTYRTSGSSSISGENTEEKTNSTVSSKGVLSGKQINYNSPAYSVTTFVIDVSNSLAVNSFNKSQIKIYPIPFSKECLFQLPRNL